MNETDELTYRAPSEAVLQLLRQADSGALAVPERGLVTLCEGGHTALRWQFDVSAFDGTDVWG